MAEHFPSFLWVLRDFMLELKDINGNEMTSSAYLEDCLAPIKGRTDKNELRQTITSVFSKRDCVALVRPVLNEKTLQNLNSAPFESLRPEFKKQIKNLKMKVYSEAMPKHVNGACVNGSAFVKLAGAYVDALNSGSLPVIHSAWQSVVELQAREAIDFAQSSFDRMLEDNYNPNISYDIEELQELFEQIEAKVITILKTKMVGNEEIRRRYEDRFRDIIKKLKVEKMKYNTLRAKEMARGVIEKLWNKSNLDNRLENYDNADDFEKDKKKIWNEFLKNTKGPAKDVEDIGRSFLEKKKIKL